MVAPFTCKTSSNFTKKLSFRYFLELKILELGTKPLSPRQARALFQEFSYREEVIRKTMRRLTNKERKERQENENFRKSS
jgi:hypothetical protein